MNIKTCKYLQAEEEPRLDYYCYYYYMFIIIIIRGEGSLITRTTLGTKISEASSFYSVLAYIWELSVLSWWHHVHCIPLNFPELPWISMNIRDFPGIFGISLDFPDFPWVPWISGRNRGLGRTTRDVRTAESLCLAAKVRPGSQTWRSTTVPSWLLSIKITQQIRQDVLATLY
jgi:hypothetical protein